MKNLEIVSALASCILLHREQCHCTHWRLTEINAGQTLMAV